MRMLRLPRGRRPVTAHRIRPSWGTSQGSGSVGARNASRGLCYGHELPRRYVVQLLHDARRPFDAHRVDARRVGQTELRVQALLVGFAVAPGDVPQLPATCAPVERLDTHLR